MISLYSPTVLCSSYFLTGASSVIFILYPFIFFMIYLVSASSNSSSSSYSAYFLFLAYSSRCYFCCMTILSLTAFSITLSRANEYNIVEDFAKELVLHFENYYSNSN